MPAAQTIGTAIADYPEHLPGGRLIKHALSKGTMTIELGLASTILAKHSASAPAWLSAFAKGAEYANISVEPTLAYTIIAHIAG